jgi:hypothetical protein
MPKQKKMSKEDFNAMYDALFITGRTPSARPVKGSMFGTKSYREQ